LYKGIKLSFYNYLNSLIIITDCVIIYNINKYLKVIIKQEIIKNVINIE